jgi:hypothetical protein
MIDTTAETILSLSQAADELPRRRRGRKTHVSTLYRWATSGCRGVRLETIQVGATRCTSREAIQRFCERLSQSGDGADQAPPRRSALKAIGNNYFTCVSVAFGLMVMSYFGRVADRFSRASIPFISLAGTRTPSG